jgi:hypothetical protein
MRHLLAVMELFYILFGVWIYPCHYIHYTSTFFKRQERRQTKQNSSSSPLKMFPTRTSAQHFFVKNHPSIYNTVVARAIMKIEEHEE